MKRKLILIALLVLALIIMLALRGKGDKTADADDASGLSQNVADASVTGESADAQLGALTENENGGINIAVTADDGTVTTYTFKDVAVDAWYAEAVDYAVSSGMMTGDDEQQLFLPDYGISRAQFAVMIYRLADGTPLETKASFSDLDGSEWFYDYVNWAVGNGLMGGKADGTFDPEGFLSCEQALIVLYRLAGEPEIKGTLEGYPYAPKVSDSGRDAVTWAWNNGLITEQECVWYPTQAVSRAQVALLMLRYDRLMNP